MSREVSNVFLLPARPSKPLIYSSAGKEVEEVAGPVREGGEVRLYCSTQGGDPTPTIVWRKDSVPLPAAGLDIDQASGQVRSTLVISGISSRDQASNISCTATNSELVEPVTSTVSLQVIGEIPGHLVCNYISSCPVPPVRAQIIRELNYFTAGSASNLTCLVSGSRPSPVTNMWVGSRQLTAIHSQVGQDKGFCPD